jgi:hypothetical protein
MSMWLAAADISQNEDILISASCIEDMVATAFAP